MFRFCFVPVLKEAFLNDYGLAQRIFDYLRKMEIDEDNFGGEVAEIVVLEEILDCRNCKTYNEFGGTEYVYIRLHFSISDCCSCHTCKDE